MDHGYGFHPELPSGLSAMFFWDFLAAHHIDPRLVTLAQWAEAMGSICAVLAAIFWIGVAKTKVLRPKSYWDYEGVELPDLDAALREANPWRAL